MQLVQNRMTRVQWLRLGLSLAIAVSVAAMARADQHVREAAEAEAMAARQSVEQQISGEAAVSSFGGHNCLAQMAL